MNNLPRQTLRQIVAKHGRDICSDSRRCEALLNDLCGAYRREINVLVNAVEEHIPLDLLAAGNSMPRKLLLARLEKRLEDQTGLTAEAARWAVESWALALGVISEAEIEERKREQSNLPSAAAIRNDESEGKSTNQGAANVNQANPVPPQLPIPSPKTAPPVNKPQTKTSRPAPPVHLPTKNQPPVRTPKSSPPFQPSNPTTVSGRSFNIFRGCLLVICFLAVASIVLFLGVPYAIEVMRETQRERNNEPPRFPIR